ncbi:Uma2 family endonuclease [Stratiformator vulcanicus]|uniref:Putative restriction endonuclease domain-containing protein n=1 Tax=Stratiformator vulcanicus TaxID=2527980 RepID=A0A517QXX1_9PLAN|nr:Uma2 family endonuclease [Stratiformator vulcanicus]QDT36481.1 hypothetical protein Pan189_08380 [Stratiformator vulcanicus]
MSTAEAIEREEFGVPETPRASATNVNATVLYGIPWETYVALREMPENFHVRMTYDDGMLELMSPKKPHGRPWKTLSMFVAVYCEEWDIPQVSFADLTLQLEKTKKGAEPDDCFYIGESVELGMDEERPAEDPPPDLMIESDWTSSSKSRLQLYAKLKIPEVWRWKRETLEILRLSTAGDYEPSELSQILSGFPAQEAAELIRSRTRIGRNDTVLIKEFRKLIADLKNAGETDE